MPVYGLLTIYVKMNLLFFRNHGISQTLQNLTGRIARLNCLISRRLQRAHGFVDIPAEIADNAFHHIIDMRLF